MPASPNKPTAAATPRGAADELRIRKIAEKCEDKAFKFAQQPVIGQPQSAAPPPAPRAPRLSEVRQAASARPSRPRQGGIPARAAASSVRAHGLWAGNDALLSSRDGNGWFAQPGETGEPPRLEPSRASLEPEEEAAPPLGMGAGARGMSEPLRIEVPVSWGTPALVPSSAALSARPGSGRPGATHHTTRPASARSIASRPASARGAAGGGAGGGAGGAPGSARGGKSLADYHVLAAACRRVGRHRQEAVAHFSSGVLHENSGAPARAIASYLKMIAAAAEGGDLLLQAVGHNYRGCCHQQLGQYAHAAEAHQAHLDLQLGESRYIGHLNLGLAQAAQGDHRAAAESQQLALRFAVRSSSLEAEALASANLGLAGHQAGDLEGARACLHRHMQLAEALRGGTSAEAYAKLAQLERDAGQIEAAAECFHVALESARLAQQQAAVNATKLELGLMHGNLEFDDWMRQSVQSAPPQPETLSAAP